MGNSNQTHRKTQHGAGGMATHRLTRHEQTLQRQMERRHALARAQRIKQIKRYALWGGGVLSIALIMTFIIHSVTTANATSRPISGVVTYANLSRQHVNGTVSYAQIPPVGGNHGAQWLNCGIYDSPVPNENAVHSLEHGAVWITYAPTLAQAQVQRLIDAAKGQAYVILSPYPDLPAPVVASAWGTQLKLQSATDPRLAEFIQKYQQGPQTPEPGGECSGGVGAPVNAG
ncbi:MAG TPA: DUF3105 domain-containing protein [Ktedonobacterales bacterium]|nr:DUF3105 domain-containing protein [Ktedonobacterales bacterium]